jgi:mRNA-degrading endonuclease RelE of RelBE toxin-antitoxin system
MRVIITPKAQKDFKNIPKSEQKKIEKRLSILINNPFFGKRLSGELKELRSLRAWPYRIVYYISSDDKLYITSIVHRQGAYKK